MDPINVLVWGTAEHGACAYFRGHLYDAELARLGINLRHISTVNFIPAKGWEDKDPLETYQAGKMQIDTSDLEWADVLMLRRYYNTAITCANNTGEYPTCPFRTHDEAEARKHEHGYKNQDHITRTMWPVLRDLWQGAIVYETDDDHWSIRPWNGYYGDVLLERDLIRDMAQSADLLTVATPVLAQRYGIYNRNIRVVRNAIDPDLYVKDVPRPEGDKPRLVYYGSTARMRDYAGKFLGYKDAPGYAAQAVEAVRSKLTTVFLGANEGTERVIARFFDEQTPYLADIPAFSRALANSHGDIGLAPLGGDDFDRAKSELHWLEYAVTDMAFIGQRYKGEGPYSVIRPGVDGLLARGSQEWHDGVKALATSRDLREQLAGAAKERVLAEYDYRVRAVEWADAFRWAAEHAGQRFTRKVA
jgi:hypothetical protein